MKTRAIAILGSSRSDSNTRRLLDLVLNDRPIEVIDLARLNFGYYDYQHRNAEDDFARLAPKLIEARAIIFATPFYWYAMSAPLKTFFGPSRGSQGDRPSAWGSNRLPRSLKDAVGASSRV